MKALVCDSFGSLEDIRYRDIDEPVPGPGEILVRVRAAAAVFTDVLFALGRYPATPSPAGRRIHLGPAAQRCRCPTGWRRCDGSPTVRSWARSC